MSTLVAADLRGIQAFVYGSRRLIDAIGRAALVDTLTDPQGSELKSLVDHHGGTVIAAGAGGLSVLFSNQDAARGFTAGWTRRVTDASDHLDSVVVHLDASTAIPGPTDIADALRLARHDAQLRHEPATDPGITSRCAVTGRPAELVRHTDSRGLEVLASETAAARALARNWHESQSTALLPASQSDPEWVLSTHLERLGRDTGELSRLAVVHADFNGLGKLLSEYASQAGKQSKMMEVSRLLVQIVAALNRHLVTGITQAAKQVTTHASPRWVIAGHPTALAVHVHDEQGKPVVPLRPIVAAGDDITFVCDARLAWSVTARIIDWLNTDVYTLTEGDPRRALYDHHEVFQDTAEKAARGTDKAVNLTVGVGIATLPVGSPITTAYESAANLCDWAKDVRVGQYVSSDHIVAWTPQQFPINGGVGDLTARVAGGLSAQPYTGNSFTRLLRDYLGDATGSLRPNANGPARSWVKNLPELIAAGPKALAAEVDRRRVNAAATAELDSKKRVAMTADAVDLLDVHLDVHWANDQSAEQSGAEQ